MNIIDLKTTKKATLPQYDIEPKAVFHDATRNQSFNFAKSAKATPLWVPGQDHTRVPNIVVSQKMPYLDDNACPFKMRGEHKADREGRRVET